MLGAGCAQSRDDEDASPAAGGGGSGAGGGGVSLTFDRESATLSPREVRTFVVSATPPQAYDVRFSVLSDRFDSNTGDASLERSLVVSDALGTASVTLTAPSKPVNLLLRAQVQGATPALLPVAILPDAATSLDVHPGYSGNRRVSQWTAAAFVNRSCDDLTFPYSETPDYQVSAPAGSALLLGDLTVPASGRVALVLRGDELVAGCSTVTDLPVGEVRSVTVPVSNRSVDLANLELDLTFSIAADDPAFREEYSQAKDEMKAALRGEADSEVTALLDALRAVLASTAERTQFDRARSAGAWDVALAQRFGAEPPLGTAVERWAGAARAALLSDRAVEAALSSLDEAGSAPTFSLERLGGVSAEEALASLDAGDWSVDAADQLTFPATLTWSRSALVAGLLRAPASAETGEGSVAQAFASVVGCAELAAQSATGESDAELEFRTSCDAACWQSACELGLELMWQRARAVSADTRSELLILASGSVELDARARAQSLSGSWAGKLVRGKSNTQTQGKLRGAAPLGEPQP